MRVGTRHNGVEGFQGLMDDVRLYRAPLKDSDVSALALLPPPLPFDFTSIARSANGSSVTLKFRSKPGRTYSVFYSTGLLNQDGQPGGWLNLEDNLASGGAETIFTDSIASNLPRAFYQVRDVTP